jgi:hypothetical protein
MSAGAVAFASLARNDAAGRPMKNDVLREDLAGEGNGPRPPNELSAQEQSAWRKSFTRKQVMWRVLNCGSGEARERGRGTGREQAMKTKSLPIRVYADICLFPGVSSFAGYACFL